jgi:hypothetical protein
MSPPFAPHFNALQASYRLDAGGGGVSPQIERIR